MFVVSSLVKSFTEVFIYNPWNLSNIMSVENHIPSQVLSRAMKLVLSITLSVINYLINQIN